MTADALKVALLARPGVACDRLRGVLEQAGAQCVLLADPTELTLPQLVEAAPKVVLVALDPQTEDVLDRFDDVLLSDAGVEVIYEEASLAAAREGWDVARWQRHLVAKLQQHGDVLPPGTEPEEVPEPDSSVDARALDIDDGGMSDAVVEGTATPAAEVVEPPAAGFRPEPVFEAQPEAPGPVPGWTPEAAFEVAPPVEAEPWLEPASTGMAEPFSPAAHPFDPVVAEADGDVSAAWASDAGFDIADTVAGATLDGESGLGLVDMVEPAAVAVGLVDSQEAERPAGIAPDMLGSTPTGVPETGPAAGFGTLTLDDGSAPVTTLDNDDARSRFQRDISDLEVRISGLSLVDDLPATAPVQASGAVLVLAGLGGPDAVRQLLGAIPDGFPRPVLVQQRLDGGRYDKLVAQMQRATTVPVRLAEPGQYAHAGVIYILPAAVGVDIGDTGIRFNQGGELLTALPSSDSAVLLLSGSDPAQVDAVLRHGWAGALIAGQAADGCYDAAAPNALAARGGDTGSAAELAQRLAERWPA